MLNVNLIDRTNNVLSFCCLKVGYSINDACKPQIRYLAGHYETAAAIYPCVYDKYGIQITERAPIARRISGILSLLLLYPHCAWSSESGRLIEVCKHHHDAILVTTK